MALLFTEKYSSLPRRWLLLLFWSISTIVCVPTFVSAEVIYSGLIGGIDRGDGASLPTLGFKIAFDGSSGWEVTYARGGIRTEGSYFEKERLLSLQYRVVASGSVLDTFLGGGLGVANASSEAQGNTESVTNLGVAISTGINWSLAVDFGLKVGLDSLLIIVPNTLPLYSIGVRNLWYVGIMIGF